MGNKLLKKLNNRDGASISFALVAFIVASVVSLVIVSAALTNAIHIRHERENEQAYLIAQSVADALKDQILATVYMEGAGEHGEDTTNRFVEMKMESDGVNTRLVVSSPSEGTEKQKFSEPLKSTLETLCARYQRVAEATDGTTIAKSDLVAMDVQVERAEGKLSDEVVARINDTDTKITCYIPKAAYDGTKISSDYYDLDFLIEVPTYGDRTYTCILHFDAKATGMSEDDVCVFWTSARMLKGDGTE